MSYTPVRAGVDADVQHAPNSRIPLVFSSFSLFVEPIRRHGCSSKQSGIEVGTCRLMEPRTSRKPAPDFFQGNSLSPLCLFLCLVLFLFLFLFLAIPFWLVPGVLDGEKDLWASVARRKKRPGCFPEKFDAYTLTRTLFRDDRYQQTYLRR
ncbi:hypothetical protein B0T19DRAFT_16608 [Cercophora scortea]|uniref:Transmembrane protein n=1 Tax=Cercophora scortea TaxID=314031 RepID=A0AAE0MK97_9PEZI|nr:hypothetical protein B0T19DRAFT_16608 [Cercophora scortea]